MTAQIRFFRGASGHRIAYATAGAGPALVFPAWWISHAERDLAAPRFRDFFGRLAEHFTVVRYDRRGVGLSDRDRVEFALDGEVRDLEALVAELRLDRLSLFGFSCGGAIAIRFAALHPEKVERLVLYGSYACGGDLAPPDAREALVALVRASWGLGSRTLAELFVPGVTADEARTFAAEQRSWAAADMAARLLELTYRMDVGADVARLRVPTLVLHRRGDRAIAFERGRELAGRIPGAVFVPLEGGVHMPWEGDPGPVLDALLAFFGVSDARSAPHDVEDGAVLRRQGDVWQVRFAGRTVHVKHSRGIADLALLLATPGESIHVADLMNGVGTPRERPGADPVLDDRALADYRERLAALEAALGAVEAACDAERSAALDEERAALLKELRAATGKGGRRRTLHAADERARKAVSSRLRDGVARLRDAHPDLGRHLDESLVTGTWCSYSPRRPIRWST